MSLRGKFYELVDNYYYFDCDSFSLGEFFR